MELQCPQCKNPIYPQQEQMALGDIPFHRVCLREVYQRAKSGEVPLINFEEEVCVITWREPELA
jgi:hypothetical protein